MIWTTAKSTEVNKRRTARPIRSNTSGVGGRAVSAHGVAGLAIGRSSGTVRRGSVRGFGGGAGRSNGRRVAGGAGCGRWGERNGPGGLERLSEVGHEVVEILEPDRAAEQAGRDPGGGERGVVELAVGRRGRMADDREDAPER